MQTPRTINKNHGNGIVGEIRAVEASTDIY